MRISSLYHSQAMLAQMNTNNDRLSKLMEQMSTQKRVKRAVGRSGCGHASGSA